MGKCKCALCGEDKELIESHIISKFFYDMMKKASATGKIRSSSNPRQRLQDGFKIYLLCNSCEQRFGKLERVFQRKYAAIFNNNLWTAEEFPEVTYKFIISLAWRVTIFILKNSQQSNCDFTKRDIDELEYHLEKMRLFLLEQQQLEYKMHCIPFKKQVISDPDLLHYGAFCISPDVRVFDNKILIYIKVPYLLFIVYLKSDFEELNDWNGTYISQGNSKVGENNIKFPDSILDYCLRQLSLKHEKLDDKTKEKAGLMLNTKEALAKISQSSFYKDL